MVLNSFFRKGIVNNLKLFARGFDKCSKQLRPTGILEINFGAENLPYIDLFSEFIFL